MILVYQSILNVGMLGPIAPSPATANALTKASESAAPTTNETNQAPKSNVSSSNLALQYPATACPNRSLSESVEGSKVDSSNQGMVL